LKLIIKRSQNDEALERVLNIKSTTKPLLFGWVSIEVILSIIYIVVFVLEYKHGSDLQAIVFMGIAGFICIFLILVMRLFGSFPYYFFGNGFGSGVDCYGTITFNAVLSKAHYETLFVFWTGILAELGALGIMLHQIRRAIREGKGSSNLTVG